MNWNLYNRSSPSGGSALEGYCMNWKAFLKSKLFLLAVGVVWLFFIIIMSPIQIPVTLLAVKVGGLREYRYGIWIAQDQLVNALLYGNPDVTVSSRVGWLTEQGSTTALYMAKFIDSVFYLAIGQENHCKVSIEKDEEHKGRR